MLQLYFGPNIDFNLIMRNTNMMILHVETTRGGASLPVHLSRTKALLLVILHLLEDVLCPPSFVSPTVPLLFGVIL